MKSKKNIYILLLLVLLIWAAVLYQVFSYVETGVPHSTATAGYKIKPLQIRPPDTFSININYRDPFLGKMHIPSKLSTVKRASVPSVTKAEVPWPTIAYKGIVSDTKDKTKVFMLIIEGKTALMKAGQTENGVLLKGGDRVSVTVTCKGRTDRITLQQ